MLPSGAHWRLRRLGAMTGGEIATRAVREVRHRVDDLEWRLARGRWRRRWRPSSILGVERSHPVGFLTRERAEALAARDPDAASAIVARADAVLRGEVSFFAYPPVVVPVVPRDYSHDPHVDFVWPRRHGKQIDYRNGPADPKWIWELNRCQDVPILVQAWLLEGNIRYAQGAASTLLDWVAQNPPGRGVAWTSGFEAAMRSLSLATAYDGLTALPEVSASLQDPVLHSLWQHAHWIERDPSTHSSANNHRLAELVGLLTIALLAPELPDSDRRAARACEELSLEAQRQILVDGTSAEQSFAYGVFVLDLLCLAVAVLDAAGRDVPKDLTGALERGSHALWAQCGGRDEPEPTYGDNDDGRALRLDGLDARRARGVAAAICARLGLSTAKAVASSLDPTAFWLFGQSGALRFDEAEPASPPGDAFLDAAGLAVLRRGATRLMFDAGPLGYLSLAAHGHADALALTVSSKETPLVVDPGTGSYFRRPEVRDAFRGTGFHPTVLIDAADQSSPGGPFLWSRHAKSWFDRVELEEGIVTGEHDGYAALAEPVRHQRVVFVLEPTLIAVHDRLESSGAHSASVRWPLHPALAVEIESGNVVRANHGQCRLTLAFAAEQPGTLSIERGTESPLLGWYSARLEEVVPAPLVKWDTAFSGRLDVVTVLCPQREGATPRIEASMNASVASVTILLRTGTESQTLRIDLDASNVLEHRHTGPNGLAL